MHHWLTVVYSQQGQRMAEKQRPGRTQIGLWLTDDELAKLDSLIPELGRDRTAVVRQWITTAYAESERRRQGLTLEALAERVARLEAERQPPLEESEE